MPPLPLRHLHLDYHTSEHIALIANEFDRASFQAGLRLARVASVNLFAKCWHGWSYFPSTTNPVHPGLTFDLLGAQIEAAQAIGVQTVVYISTGPDEKDAQRLQSELKHERDGTLQRNPDFTHAGFHMFCLATRFRERVLATIAEVLVRYPCAGLWLDGAAFDPPCWCDTCRARMATEDIDPDNSAAVLGLSRGVFESFGDEVQALVDQHRPGISIFHNSGHIPPGQRSAGRIQTHFELESLPTAGWGYDHFPISARHVRTWGKSFLGMTGRFHRGWGEFGGYKHPDALRWEAACCLAYGGGISIGDQLHPNGRMDLAACALIGAACEAVEAVEPWCVEARALVEVGVLISEAVDHRSVPSNQPHYGHATVGALRLLEECQIQFDIIDAEADFNAYRAMVLPEGVRIDTSIRDRIRAFVANGGRVLACGDGGLDASGSWPVDLGATWHGVADVEPTFYRPLFAVPDWQRNDLLCQGVAHELSLASGTVLAWRRASVFPRRAERFCSHAHAPSAGVDLAPGLVTGPDGVVVGWNICSDFAVNGNAATRTLFAEAMHRLLDGRQLVRSSLPPGGLVALTHQVTQRRTLVHVVWAPRRRKGDIEVIDEVPVLSGITVTLTLPHLPIRATFVPDGTQLTLTPCAAGVRLVVPRLHIHALICLEYA